MSTLHTGETAPIGTGDKPLVAGDVVGEYVIAEQLGKGGFGTVYRAAHPVIGKQVAIKVLARRYSADEAIVSRFVAEARAVNQIRHRNIIDIFSFGQLPDGRHYYVMEYLDGTPLDKHLKAHGALGLEQALPILRAIARALDAAHAKNIAHRDLKPENIVLSFDEDGKTFPKLLDFGIAKLTTPEEEQAHRTGTGVPLGTPYYMSPEQCRGRDVDHRTDIYSLGVLTFRLLTGDYPFHGEMIEILHKHMHDPAPLASSVMPGLPADVDRAIAWMLKKDPAARPQTASAAIAGLLGEGSLPAITPGTLTPQTIRVGPRSHGNAGTEDTLASAPTVTPDIPAPPRSRAPLVIGLVLVCGAGGAIAWWKLSGGSPAAPDAMPATPPVVESKQPPVPELRVDAAATPETRVIITLDGAPEGTRVTVAGKEVGFSPVIELPQSEQPTVLALAADGYVPTSITVTPNKAQSVNAKLRKKPTSKTTRPTSGSGSGSGSSRSTKDDLESVPGLEGN